MHGAGWQTSWKRAQSRHGRLGEAVWDSLVAPVLEVDEARSFLSGLGDDQPAPLVDLRDTVTVLIESVRTASPASWVVSRRAGEPSRGLRATLAHEVPPALNAVLRELGVDDRNAKRRMPDLCGAVRDRHTAWRAAELEDVQLCREAEVRRVIAEIDATGR